MTRAISGAELAGYLTPDFASFVVEAEEGAVIVSPESVPNICFYLREHADLRFDYLTDLTSVDYIDYFEVVYHLMSFEQNLSATLKTRAYGRKSPTVPSVTSVWRGADMQEREVWDLMGIRFEGHPNLRRVLLFDGFPGHPLRKDFLEFDHRTVPLPADEDL